MKRVPVTLAKAAVRIAVDNNPDNVVDACEYIGAGGATDRCLAGEAFSIIGVDDRTLGELEGIVNDEVYQIPGYAFSENAVAYLRAAQAYQDGDAVAAGLAAGTDLAFERDGSNQPWAKAKQFADLFYEKFTTDSYR